MKPDPDLLSTGGIEWPDAPERRGSITIDPAPPYTVPAVRRAATARALAAEYRSAAAGWRADAAAKWCSNPGRYWALAREYDAKAAAFEAEHDRLLDQAVVELEQECMAKLATAPLLVVAPAPPQALIERLRVRLRQERHCAETADYLNRWRPDAAPSHRWAEVRRIEARIAEIEHNNFLEDELR